MICAAQLIFYPQTLCITPHWLLWARSIGAIDKEGVGAFLRSFSTIFTQNSCAQFSLFKLMTNTLHPPPPSRLEHPKRSRGDNSMNENLLLNKKANDNINISLTTQ